MTTKFKNPPINEVVIATYFNPPLFNLRAEHIGVFWSLVRNQFPKIEQQPPVGGIIEAPGEIFPLPRFWIISENDSTLIQIQKNAFIFNWRRREEEYPHFDNVKSEFDKYFQIFSDFIKIETDTPDINIDVCELTYVNMVMENEYWNDLNDVTNVIPSFRFVELNVKETKETRDINYITTQQLDDQLNLKVTVQSAHPDEMPEKTNLRFEIRASGRLGEATKSEADKWFERAHDITGACFISMTNPDIQKKYWQLVERE